MKKLKLIVIAALIMAIPLFAFVSTTHAGNFRSSNNAVIKKGEVIDHTLFIAGNNVEINGEIKGDVFCAGQNITINAKVSGDVLCAGMNVRVDGIVEGDVRVAGQVVVLAATVGHNASLTGGTITTEQISKINGDLQAAGNVLNLNGAVARDSDIAGDTITLNNQIGRNVAASTPALALEADAKISGDLTYYSNEKMQKADQAQVVGKVTQNTPQTHEQSASNPVAEALSGGLISLVMLLALAMVVAALFPQILHAVSDSAIKKPGTTALVGLAATIGMPMLIIGSFLTIVGIFLGVTLLFFWIVVMLLASVFFSYYIGRLVLSRASSKHPLLVMLVGVLIVSVLMVIPMVNVLTAIAIVLFGSGMIVRELFSRTSKPVYEKASPVAKAKKK